MSKIKQGQKFVCIKTVIMNGDKTEAYTKGYIYNSEDDFCITNNQNETNHSWTKYNKETKEYFLKIKNKENE
jgi:hypothetical protein